MNAPAGFQRYMEETVEGFRDKFALPYLDDIIVYSQTFEQHLDHVTQVLKKVKQRGLKLNMQKCSFFQSSVKFLGRIVSKEGYHIDEDNVKAARALKDFVPRNVGDVRHLLGLIGYHRRHIQDYSRRAKPLSNLLKEDQEKTSQSESSLKLTQTSGEQRDESCSKEKQKFRKKKSVEWSDECQTALNSLIDDITSAPILAYPDFTKEFILHTDASSLGLGAILYQKQDGAMRVIAYASRTLNKIEENYHATKLEFLALKWAITEKFRDYLGYANHFWVFTDNNPLTYLMDCKKLNAYGERWISELSEFNFTTKYRPGVINRDPDCLSRLPLNIEAYMNECSEEIKTDAFRAIMAQVQVKMNFSETWRVAINALNVEKMEHVPLETITDNIKKIKNEQNADINLCEIMKFVSKKAKPKIFSTDNSEIKVLKRGFRKLQLTKDGVLVRDGQEGHQIVLPKSMRSIVYQSLHVDMGHMGPEKVYGMAKTRVYWPGMESDITNFINKNCLCLMQKKPHVQQKAALHSIITTMPMELVTIDFLKVEKGMGGYEYILVLVDHFTRFAQAYPTKNKSSVTVAKKLYNDFVLRFGIPARLLSDQGGEFENRIIKELNKHLGICKSRTTPYHPQTNGSCERMNQTLLKMLKTLSEKEKSKWPESINKLIHAYNCSSHSSTGYSPFFLMFGRQPRLPIDLMLAIEKQDDEINSHNTFVDSWQKQMKDAYEIAHRRSTQWMRKDGISAHC